MGHLQHSITCWRALKDRRDLWQAPYTPAERLSARPEAPIGIPRRAYSQGSCLVFPPRQLVPSTERGQLLPCQTLLCPVTQGHKAQVSKSKKIKLDFLPVLTTFSTPDLHPQLAPILESTTNLPLIHPEHKGGQDAPARKTS